METQKIKDLTSVESVAETDYIPVLTDEEDNILEKIQVGDLLDGLLDDVYRKSEIDALIEPLQEEVEELNGICPVGTIIAYPTDSIPDKFLECDGSSLLRSQYQALFDVIGTTYGSVDSTHFNLPNFQGAFLRGAGSQTLDERTFTSAEIGTAQGDDVKPHTHGYSKSNYADYAQSGGGSSNFMSWNQSTVQTTSTGTETRPLNYAVKWLIRY